MHVARGDAVLGGVESNLMVASVLLSEFLVPPVCEHSVRASLFPSVDFGLSYFILFSMVWCLVAVIAICWMKFVYFELCSKNA